MRYNYINFMRKTTVPIRDMLDPAMPVVFLVDVYGVTSRDLLTIGPGIGSRPLVKAVKRMGLDPDRYQAFIWDVPA